MCGGIAGPPMGDERPIAYYRPVTGRVSCKEESGGMKKECSCGQINPTNTKCWSCGKPNHYSNRKK